jgi:acetyl-CoA acetyltransferase
MEEAVVSAVQTPTGSFGGQFKDISVRDLGARAVKPALARVAPHGADVDCAIGPLRASTHPARRASSSTRQM